MKKLNANSRIALLSRILFVFFAVTVVSCEELTDSLTPRDNIIDTWKCTETAVGGGTDTFLVEITADNASSSGINIDNFNLLGIVVKASVSGSSITISSQEVDGFTISGSGTITADYEKITLKYSVDDGGGKENYNAVLTKP